MKRERTSRVVGVVLRARNLGEADRIFTLLTSERGKIDAVAKGVRRNRSSFSGRLEFLNEVSLELHHGRSLDVITSAEVISTHFNTIVAPEAFATASLIAEYVDASCEPEQQVFEVFALLQSVLHAFERTLQPTDLLPRFELRLLGAIGLAPELEQCLGCGISAHAERDFWFDLQEGGIACVVCMRGREGCIELARDDLENIRALARPAGGSLPVTMRARPVAIRIIERLMVLHLGTRPRVQAALDILRALPQPIHR